MNTIEIDNVSVRYRTQRVQSIKAFMIDHITRRSKPTYFYSLTDVSAVISSGESVGVIGSNGAGKSTLLRVAAGIISPSVGVATTRGTVAPLIELGTGFETELSGRENIFFNGALLGRSRSHMRQHLDGIIDFAGLEQFIDQPLRTYSTGMVARLAFGIATAVEAETILLDEILSVGDASFRAKSRQRIRRFVEQGATMMVVSHELDSIADLCSRTIWLDRGRIVDEGPSAEVVARYKAAKQT